MLQLLSPLGPLCDTLRPHMMHTSELRLCHDCNLGSCILFLVSAIILFCSEHPLALVEMEDSCTPDPVPMEALQAEKGQSI